MTPAQREAAERLVLYVEHEAISHGPTDYKHRVAALLRELLADSVGACKCGDRAAAACPGEWELGCDLGANAKYARAVDPGPAVEALKAEPQGEPVACGQVNSGVACTTLRRGDERLCPDCNPRKRKPLTEGERNAMVRELGLRALTPSLIIIATERKHGIGEPK